MSIRFLQQLDYFAEALRELCERRKLLFLSIFSLVYWVSTCWLASRKLMWNDELFTLYISRLTGISDVWSALLTGADQIPPLFHVITRASFYLFGINHVSIRLPEVLGFWVMSLCVFYVVAKRSEALYGFVAMIFPLVTEAHYYSYEARPYGLVLGFSGLSLLCWQLAAEGHYRRLSLSGLTLSLAAAISIHYYAVLILFPLLLGEVARSLSQRRLDLPMWLSFTSAMIPLLFFLPLIEAAQTYGTGFWSKPYWRAIPEFYSFLLTPALSPVLATVILLTIFSLTLPVKRIAPKQESRPTAPIYETTAALGYIGIPLVAVISTKLVTGAFTNRYALAAIIGVSILVAFTIYRLLEGRTIIGVSLVFSFCAAFALMTVQKSGNLAAASQDLSRTYKLLASQNQFQLPIVASDLHVFMKLTYYAPPHIAAHLVYLADPQASLRYLGHDTVDRGILDLKPWFRVKVEAYLPYITSHRQFLLYGPTGDLNWLLSALISMNRQIEVKGRNGDSLLFLVSRKD